MPGGHIMVRAGSNGEAVVTILLSEEDETDTVEVASGRQTKQAMQSARARPFLDHLSI